MQQLISDTTCFNIAVYLQNAMNDYTSDAHGYKMIKSIRDYDDQTVVLNDYPCLRVIRMTDVFNFNSFRTNTSLVIKYSVVVKANYREVQVLTQMGKILHDLISKTPDITVDESRRPTGRVMMITSTNQELIGHYIYEFSIIDSSVPEYSPSVNFN